MNKCKCKTLFFLTWFSTESLYDFKFKQSGINSHKFQFDVIWFEHTMYSYPSILCFRQRWRKRGQNECFFGPVVHGERNTSYCLNSSFGLMNLKLDKFPKFRISPNFDRQAHPSSCLNLGLYDTRGLESSLVSLVSSYIRPADRTDML